MKAILAIFITLLALHCVCLIPHSGDQIKANIAIGKIENVKIMKKHIIFRSEEKYFGIINKADGKILRLFELQEGEKIISETYTGFVISYKNRLNLFSLKNQKYHPMVQNIFLTKHKFSKLISLIYKQKYSYTLTQKSLISFPMLTKEGDVKVSQETVILKNQDQTFIKLIKCNNEENKQFNVCLVSQKVQNKKTSACLRKIHDNQISKTQCFEIPVDKITGVIESRNRIYIEYKGGALIINEKLEKVENINEKPLQFHHGFAVFETGHKTYNPDSKTVENYRIIDEQEGMGTLVMKVTDTTLQVLNRKIPITKISKSIEEDPRKSWAAIDVLDLTKDQLYIEFADKLVFFKINEDKGTNEKVWQIKTRFDNKDLEIEQKPLKKSTPEKPPKSDKP